MARISLYFLASATVNAGEPSAFLALKSPLNSAFSSGVVSPPLSCGFIVPGFTSGDVASGSLSSSVGMQNTCIIAYLRPTLSALLLALSPLSIASPITTASTCEPSPA